MRRLLLFTMTCLFSVMLFAQETQKMTCFNKRVELTIPAEFTEMSKEDIKARFIRGTPPDIVFSDKKGSPSISVSLRNNKITQETISEFVDLLEKSITEPLPEAKTKEKGVKEINGKKVGYVIMTAPSLNGEMYNYMFFTDLDQKFLLCNFSFMSRSADKWTSTANSIISSFKVN